MRSVFRTPVICADATMDLSSLSKDELTQNLRSLRRRNADVVTADNLDDVVQELQVHRVEMEMQNRALRETEVEIESALQRYCDLYDHLPIGYVTLTPTGKIVQANLTAAGWLRRDRAQLAGGYFNRFLDAFDAGRLSAHLDACLQGGSEQALELTLRLENGLLLRVQLTSRLAPSSGNGEREINTAITNTSNLMQVDVVANDITREHQEFSDSIAAQTRTPVVTVSNFARSILQDHAAELSGDVKSLIERMASAAVRMEATLHNLVEYCLGHDHVDLDPVNLEELMQHIIMEHRAIIERCHADIAVERPLPCVRGAGLLLGHVLASLFSNLLKQRKPNETPRICVSAKQHEREVVLTVREELTRSDSAPGDQDFRRFEQAHAPDCFSATWVALTIVGRTIERMNGRMWVDSEIGQPTSFHIGLPAV